MTHLTHLLKVILFKKYIQNYSRIHPWQYIHPLTLWFLPCLSKSEIMDLMCPSLIIFRASGLSTNTQCKTSRIPKDKEKKYG